MGSASTRTHRRKVERPELGEQGHEEGGRLVAKERELWEAQGRGVRVRVALRDESERDSCGAGREAPWAVSST